jgi:hypothetical protein
VTSTWQLLGDRYCILTVSRSPHIFYKSFRKLFRSIFIASVKAVFFQALRINIIRLSQELFKPAPFCQNAAIVNIFVPQQTARCSEGYPNISSLLKQFRPSDKLLGIHNHTPVSLSAIESYNSGKTGISNCSRSCCRQYQAPGKNLFNGFFSIGSSASEVISP